MIQIYICSRPLNSYRDLYNTTAILAIDELNENDKLGVARERKIEHFFSQPFSIVKRITGIPGCRVSLKETVRGLREILDGKCVDLAEQAFMMAVTIVGVREKVENLAKARKRHDVFLCREPGHLAHKTLY